MMSKRADFEAGNAQRADSTQSNRPPCQPRREDRDAANPHFLKHFLIFLTWQTTVPPFHECATQLTSAAARLLFTATLARSPRSACLSTCRTAFTVVAFTTLNGSIAATVCVCATRTRSVHGPICNKREQARQMPRLGVVLSRRATLSHPVTLGGAKPESKSAHDQRINMRRVQSVTR